uniref:uncharacterized protein LOC120336841 n=1 Tax=Styela clava TaxID=7725 RepID=UPI0019397DBA|nr:uncharacterized protein LOC120336841 [Styela clava]
MKLVIALVLVAIFAIEESDARYVSRRAYNIKVRQAAYWRRRYIALARSYNALESKCRTVSYGKYIKLLTHYRRLLAFVNRMRAASTNMHNVHSRIARGDEDMPEMEPVEDSEDVNELLDLLPEFNEDAEDLPALTEEVEQDEEMEKSED